MRPSGRIRGVVAGALAASVAMAGAFLGCIDLFHSTSFDTLCELDAAAPGCVNPASPDARRDARSLDGGRHDATKDANRDGRASAGDAAEAATDATGATDVSHDATHDAAHDSGVDAAPTNFCKWSPTTAAAKAQYACLWLGACAGIQGQNDFGTCYPMAVLAFDCTANPNQQVTGPVHAYWDALWQAKSCNDVTRAVFGAATVPTCPGASPCAANNTVAAACTDAGALEAQNCAAQGYVCAGGICTVHSFINSCTTSPPARCEDGGKIFHQCSAFAASGNDVGKDCTNFGAGLCVAHADAGVAGCLPNDAGAACSATATAMCVTTDAGILATGCATGVRETINCTDFAGTGAPPVTCSAPTKPDLPSVCYAANASKGTCNPGNTQLSEPAGASGVVTATCAAAGLGPCIAFGSEGATCSP